MTIMNLNEGLGYKDLEKMMKPKIHIDEFASKMGDDDKISVVSFLVKSQSAAEDLVNWFETGYDFVMDADRSPGQIKHNRFIVYVEMKRRSRRPQKIEELLDDLETLTEFDTSDWTVVYGDQEVPFSVENIKDLVPLSPREYRERTEIRLNDIRETAGITPVSLYDNTEDIQEIQERAGIL